jgi:membrane-associated phospholipid phosphatase
MFNLTQLGDALIFLSILSMFLIYAPIIWESLLSASLFTLLISALLKNFFAVPRPAAFLNNSSFVIIGEKLPGYSSLPSGHSITIFTTLTVLLFAFIPQKTNQRYLYFFLFILTGLSLAFTRVGIGAHYPLDVLVGAAIGYLCGLAGIFFSRSVKLWGWLGNKKYYPVLFLLLIAAGILLIMRIADHHLPIFYFALTSLIFSLYKMTDVYFKK